MNYFAMFLIVSPPLLFLSLADAHLPPYVPWFCLKFFLAPVAIVLAPRGSGSGLCKAIIGKGRNPQGACAPIHYHKFTLTFY